ncbi:hypothetical protein QC762_0031860 [Podospora pseudocomata]|uniref:Uncharacterized protein n=1 Tax=Podospora pseudocomata TaxID=2093779 RepID=A0ABR0GPV8_9PEZI|nr:hypothetical protein QC762_0031860 [Podospora pseudocomata]
MTALKHDDVAKASGSRQRFSVSAKADRQAGLERQILIDCRSSFLLEIKTYYGLSSELETWGRHPIDAGMEQEHQAPPAGLDPRRA